MLKNKSATVWMKIFITAFIIGTLLLVGSAGFQAWEKHKRTDYLQFFTRSPDNITGMALDRQGNLYLNPGKSFEETTNLYQFSPSGAMKTLKVPNLEIKRKFGGDFVPSSDYSSLAADHQGNLFFGSPYGRIYSLSSEGTMKVYSEVPSDPARNGVPYDPMGMVVDIQGNLYIATATAVLKRTPVGKWSVLATSTENGPCTAGSFRYVSRIAVDSYGNLYVSDQRCLSISKISQNGNITLLAGGSQASKETRALLSMPMGIAVANDGSIFIANTLSILRLSPNGALTRIAGRNVDGAQQNIPGPLPASLQEPLEVALDDMAGILYILSRDAIMKIHLR